MSAFKNILFLETVVLKCLSPLINFLRRINEGGWIMCPPGSFLSRLTKVDGFCVRF